MYFINDENRPSTIAQVKNTILAAKGQEVDVAVWGQGKPYTATFKAYQGRIFRYGCKGDWMPIAEKGLHLIGGKSIGDLKAATTKNQPKPKAKKPSKRRLSWEAAAKELAKVKGQAIAFRAQGGRKEFSSKSDMRAYYKGKQAKAIRGGSLASTLAYEGKVNGGWKFLGQIYL